MEYHFTSDYYCTLHGITVKLRSHAHKICSSTLTQRNVIYYTDLETSSSSFKSLF